MRSVIKYTLLSIIILIVVCIILNYFILYNNQPIYELDINNAKKFLDSGDIILHRYDNLNNNGIGSFIGKNMLYSFLIPTYYTHLSMCYKCPETGKLYAWTSTRSSGYDILTGNIKKGSALLDFDSYIGNYKGDIAVRKIFPGLTDEQKNKYREIIYKYKGMDYGIPVKDFLRGKPNKNNYVFCSELIALTLMELGILKTHKHAHQYKPSNFSETLESTTRKLLYYWQYNGFPTNDTEFGKYTFSPEYYIKK